MNGWQDTGHINTLSYHEKKRHKEKEHCKHSYSVVLYNNIHGYTLKEKKASTTPPASDKN